jgi:hypothetical protein
MAISFQKGVADLTRSYSEKMMVIALDGPRESGKAHSPAYR